MPAKPNATVCGVPAKLSRPLSNSGQHIAPEQRRPGQYASISKPGAKRLVQALFGHARLPRPGHGVKLCGDQFLHNISGSFQVTRYAAGEFAGTAKRRKPRKRR